MLVSEVIARIQAGAEFSFDFLLLLVLAGIIAFMGLMENSSVVLVASMLVSPLMGPILAGIFGGAVNDSRLSWVGVRHEVYALMICILLGVVLGLLIVPWISLYGDDKFQFPTAEMISRGELRCLWVGVLIAVPSGAGVALSVLGGNAGSLVGVAISASLLPPAVNCGLFWALSLVEFINGKYDGTSFIGFPPPVFDENLNKTVGGYQHRYSEDLSLESFLLGLVSLTLTLLNILCIIITGVLILRLKEVTAAKVPQKFQHFWRTDVKAHRDYYKAIRSKKGDERQPIDQDVYTDNEDEGDFETYNSIVIPLFVALGLISGTFLHSFLEMAETDSDLWNLGNWVPMSSSAVENSPRITTTDPWSKTGYTAVYSPRSQPKRTGSLSRHHQHRPANTNYLNVRQFLEMELSRSREVRRRLREKSGEV